MQSRLKSISNIFAFFVLLLSLFGSSVNITPAYAAGIVVNTAVDENGTGADCSLREAITAANTNAAYGGCPDGAGSDAITFAGNYTITLSSQLPSVTTVITITGNGATNTIIQASTCNPVTLPGGCTAAAYLVFDVNGGNLTLNGLTVRHGQGGIYNTAGILRLTGVSVEANSASFGAGIVNSFGTVILHESLLANNVAASFGGAVANSSGTLHVVNSTISGNAANGTGASDGGGAIDSYGSAPVMTFYNSTVTNNSAVAPNTAKSGIWREAGTSFFVNSIIANNNGANNCFRSGGSGTTIGGSNIENGDTCGLNGQNADPMLIPLAENGGLTQTHALLPGSPAINLGDTSWAVAEDDTTPLTTDQRGTGYPRIRGASVDMGAYESACIGGPYSVPAGDVPALIEAITCANATAANDVINLTNSTYTLTLQSAFEVGLPPIVTAATGGTLTINGNGATIQRSSAGGTPNLKFFEVSTGANLTLDRIMLMNGYAQVGGAIFSNGTLTITNSTIRNNYSLSGGAISQAGGASTTIMNSLIANNQAELYGGVIDMSSGTLFIINSTLSGNQILGSDPGYGGGVIDAYNTPTITIINSTIANNTAPQAARSGIWLENGTLTIANSIVANNNGANNCVITGTLIDNGGNLDNGTTCGFGGLVGQNTNPLLGALANNGGPTQTMALLSGSPAINAGDNADCEATDQRGVTRPQDGTCDIGAYERTVNPTFTDVPYNYWSWQYIEQLYNDGITGGCSSSPLNYCPANSVTRAQMAIFLLRGIHGSAYTPPAATGTMFSDVSAGSFAAAWIEQLAVEGITSGCGGGNFCPNTIVTRAQMAVFLVKARHGIAFVPPTATGVFSDVPVGSFGANYIEQLVTDGVTSGCGVGLYCPSSTVKRDSMAVFLVKNFSLP